MYKHILIPTDGSRLAAKGIRAGVQLAKRVKARVSGVYVIQPYIPQEEFKTYSQKHAKKVLAAVEQEARRAGVRCTPQSVIAAQPWERIPPGARALEDTGAGNALKRCARRRLSSSALPAPRAPARD